MSKFGKGYPGTPPDHGVDLTLLLERVDRLERQLNHVLTLLEILQACINKGQYSLECTATVKPNEFKCGSVICTVDPLVTDCM